MARKKRLANYNAFRKKHDLREEIQSALDRIAKNENVFDIDVEEPIVGHSKRPHVWIREYLANAFRATVHTVDKYGKGAGCKIKVYSIRAGRYTQDKYHALEKWLYDFVPGRNDAEWGIA
ncbi:MAG: hypothetical protein AABX10_03580 [Nanoarchaeota archaeon]